jgi:tetratricopeptide (TPR) repeat protein
MSEDFGWMGEREIEELVERFAAMLKDDVQYFFDVDEFEAIIDYYFEINNIGMSKKAIAQALLQHPSCNTFKIFEARVLTYEKKYYEALELLNHLELLEPTNDEIYISKGEIYSLKNKHELAIEEYKKSIPYTQNPEDIYANIAFEYENLNNYKETIKYLKLALEVKPDSENLIHEIAFFFEITGRTEEAITFFGEFLDKTPYSKVAWFNLGIFYNNIDLFEKAIEAYEFTLAIDETYASAYFNIANSYSGLEKYKTAIAYYEETFKFESPEATTYLYIGECYEHLDDLKSAIKNYNKALDLDDKLAEAWAAIGSVFVKQNLEKTAVKYFTKAINLMPLNLDFKYDLAMIYLGMQHYKDAESLFEDVIEGDPNHINGWINYSYSKSISDGLDKAIDIIEDSLEKNKDNALLWLRLAAYLYQTEKVQQAFYYIETALKIDPSSWAEILTYLPELKRVPRYIELLELYKIKE